ncbi:MAG TPA: hypothetical protein VLL56_08865, partial [Terriglobia bacterium]|nr:hypothetical protein [Terriglobia bacterium]
MGKRIAFVCFVVTCIIAPSGWAQDTRIQVIEQQIAEKAQNLQPPQREKGDQWITRFEKTFTPVPPGIRPT